MSASFVLTVCQHIKRASYSAEHASALGDEPETVMMRGGSALINPLGYVIAGPDFKSETIPYVDSDHMDIARGRYEAGCSTG